jgi:protease-4
MASKVSFSQRHPFLFGFFLIAAAVILILGIMAAFFFWSQSDGLRGLGRTRVGVVSVDGSIETSRRIVDWMEQLGRNPEIKGVILRINSPGGLVAPSQEIMQAVQRLSAKKPVVASMAAVAASGGYYVACAADKIVANPGTLTGSIGVKAKLANIQELMDKLGIDQETLVSGPYKDAGSPAKPLTPEERDYFQELVDDLYSQFVEAVAKGRGLEVSTVRELADGRAYTGRQARDLKLVDALGGMQTALDVLRTQAGIQGDIMLVEGPEEKRSLLSWILGSLDMEAVKRRISGPRWDFRY